MADQLTAEQKRIVKNIVEEAKKAGVDPEFAVSLANLESGFKHVPADDKKSTAYGPFQVNKATAEANGIDYDKMVKDPELAVRTGIMNIARHAKNPLFEGDPARIAAAHRYGEGSDFAKTGDLEYLKKDPVLKDYLTNAAEHFEGSQLPESIYTEPKKEEQQGAAIQQGTNNQQQPQQITNYPQAKIEIPPPIAGAAGAGLGATVGAIVGAKNAGFEAAKKVYDLAKGKISPEDVSGAVDAIKQAQEPLTSGEKWNLKTGYGEGKGTVKNVVDRAKLKTPRGKLAKDYYERLRAGESLAAAEAAEKSSIANKALEDAKTWNEAVNKVKTESSPFEKIMGGIMSSTPVRYGLHGFGMGFNAADAAQKLQNPTPLNLAGSASSLTGAIASALGLVPKFAARANPAAIGATTASQVLGDINDEKYQKAAENAMSGATAIAPRLFGPLGALTYSEGLNKGEDEELKARRAMPPTISP